MPEVRLRTLTALLTIAAVGEFIVLRSATRAIVHIPGTARFELPISIVAELGRLAYYVAVVALVLVLVTVAIRSVIGAIPQSVAAGLAIALFLVTAGAGRAEAIPLPFVGVVGMGALVVIAAAGWQGVRSTPIGLFVVGAVAAGWSVVGQNWQGGLDGRSVDVLIWTAESGALFAALTSPLLLLGSAPGRGLRDAVAPLVAGLVTAAATAAVVTAGASTLFIVVLWNIGIPGWMPGLAYAVAVGTMVATVWEAGARGDWRLLAGLLLLVIAGVGSISTYQTGLAIAGVALLSTPELGKADASPDESQTTPDADRPAAAGAFTPANA